MCASVTLTLTHTLTLLYTMTQNMNISDTEEKTLGHPVTVVDVRLKTSKRVYTFVVEALDIEPGSIVVAESEMGLSLGHVISGRYTIDDPKQPLRRIVRIATEDDIKADMENRPFEEEARAFCIERINARNLPMKLVTTEATLDRKRLIFYFTADGRIDFRELVRDLAGRFRMRIEMRQIGVRDEVRMIGGIGVCGRVTCCNSFLTSFEPVSIRMVKQQELALSQNKLLGLCGRLMCCLAYEYDGREVDEDEGARECVWCEEEVVQEIGIEEGGQETEDKGQEEASGLQLNAKEDKGKPFSKRKRFLKKRHNQ
ncbi:MAG: hypothetical protein Fur0020_05720 [Thermodesulfovibrionia bacterium]